VERAPKKGAPKSRVPGGNVRTAAELPKVKFWEKAVLLAKPGANENEGGENNRGHLEFSRPRGACSL